MGAPVECCVQRGEVIGIEMPELQKLSHSTRAVSWSARARSALLQIATSAAAAQQSTAPTRPPLRNTTHAPQTSSEQSSCPVLEEVGASAGVKLPSCVPPPVGAVANPQGIADNWLPASHAAASLLITDSAEGGSSGVSLLNTRPGVDTAQRRGDAVSVESSGMAAVKQEFTEARVPSPALTRQVSEVAASHTNLATLSSEPEPASAWQGVLSTELGNASQGMPPARAQVSTPVTIAKPSAIAKAASAVVPPASSSAVVRTAPAEKDCNLGAQRAQTLVNTPPVQDSLGLGSLPDSPLPSAVEDIQIAITPDGDVIMTDAPVSTHADEPPSDASAPLDMTTSVPEEAVLASRAPSPSEATSPIPNRPQTDLEAAPFPDSKSNPESGIITDMGADLDTPMTLWQRIEVAERATEAAAERAEAAAAADGDDERQDRDGEGDSPAPDHPSELSVQRDAVAAVTKVCLRP